MAFKRKKLEAPVAHPKKPRINEPPSSESKWSCEEDDNDKQPYLSNPDHPQESSDPAPPSASWNESEYYSTVEFMDDARPRPTEDDLKPSASTHQDKQHYLSHFEHPQDSPNPVPSPANAPEQIQEYHKLKTGEYIDPSVSHLTLAAYKGTVGYRAKEDDRVKDPTDKQAGGQSRGSSQNYFGPTPTENPQGGRPYRTVEPETGSPTKDSVSLDPPFFLGAIPEPLCPGSGTDPDAAVDFAPVPKGVVFINPGPVKADQVKGIIVPPPVAAAQPEPDEQAQTTDLEPYLTDALVKKWTCSQCGHDGNTDDQGACTKCNKERGGGITGWGDLFADQSNR